MTEWPNIHDYIFPPSSKTLKRQLIKQGYNQQMSIYGVITDKNTKESEYRRIEVLSNTPYTQHIVLILYTLFQEFMTPHKYTIFIYDGNRDGIQIKGEYD